MNDKQYSLGYDTEGVTSISLDALQEIANEGKILEQVDIAGTYTSDIICSFIFKDHGVYNASGFSVGYGGEGPHGLHKAIRLFHPDKIDLDFWNTAISKLDPSLSWSWMPKKGFIHSI